MKKRKKQTKRILGIAGLLLVGIITVLAVLIPEPNASALDTNAATDEVQVRVVGKTPKVSIVTPPNNRIFVTPDQYFQFDYANVETTTATVYYTDKDGTVHTKTIDTIDPDYEPGTSPQYPLNLDVGEFGYGEYQLTVNGVGFDGVPTEDTVNFSFTPIYGEVTDGETDGVFIAVPHYSGESPDIDSVYINVYNEDGDLIKVLSPIKVSEPGEWIPLDFVGNDLPSGRYTVEFVAYDEDGNIIYKPYTVSLDYVRTEPTPAPTPAPDTGRFMGGVGASGTDIAITCTLAFVFVAVVATVFIAKHSNTKQAKKKQK